MRTLFTTILVLSLLTFFLNGVVHAVVPHEHAHGQEAKWEQLHGSLRQEEQAIFIISAELLVVAFVILVACIAPRVVVPERELSLLRRGIHKYRAFG